MSLNGAGFMDDLKLKIVGLVQLLGKPVTLDFLCDAFNDTPREQIAVSVVELCTEGAVTMQADGIKISERRSKNSPKLEDKQSYDEEKHVVSLGQTDYDENEYNELNEFDSFDNATEADEGETSSTSNPENTNHASKTNSNKALKPKKLKSKKYISSKVLHINDLCENLPLPGRILKFLKINNIKTLHDLVKNENRLFVIENLTTYDIEALRDCLHSGTGPALDAGVREWKALQRQYENSEYVFDGYGFLELVPASLRLEDPFSFDLDAFFNSFGKKTIETAKAIKQKFMDNHYWICKPSAKILLMYNAKRALDTYGSQQKAVDEVYADLSEDGRLNNICQRRIRMRLDLALNTSDEQERSFYVPEGTGWERAVANECSNNPRVSIDVEHRKVNVRPLRLTEWLEQNNFIEFDVLKKRLCGQTLQEIASDMAITRERVRQLTNSALENRPPLEEDAYLEEFEKYNFTQHQFSKATGQDAQVYNYLQLVATTTKGERKPLSDALDDASASDDLKRDVAKPGVLGDYAVIDGQLIEASKQAIVEHLVCDYASEQPISLEYLLEIYEEFLRKAQFDKVPRLQTRGIRSFGSCISHYNKIMYARVPADNNGERKGIRYYDTTKLDFTKLKTAIEKLASKNIECSAELLMGFPELEHILHEYDITNGYELHWVLSRYCTDIENVSCSRVPMITLGTANRQQQVLDVIKSIGPASVNELAQEYEKRYKVAQATFKGNYLGNFGEYCKDGIYSVNE